MKIKGKKVFLVVTRFLKNKRMFETFSWIF